MALEITDSNFEDIVLKSDKPVMVDFWAEWCGPCRVLGPIIEELSEKFQGKAVVGKLDVDTNQEFAAKYGIRNIPTVLIFHKRRRKHSRKKNGHRQRHSKIQITKILAKGGKIIGEAKIVEKKKPIKEEKKVIKKIAKK